MTSEDILEKRRRHDVAIDVPEQHSSDRRSLQMVGRLAAAVVHDDGLSQQARHQDRRKGSQQERPIRRGKDVNDVGRAEAVSRAGANRSAASRASGDSGYRVLAETAPEESG